MSCGGRALRGFAFATVLRSTAHSSYRRSPPIPNAVVHTKGVVANMVFLATVLIKQQIGSPKFSEREFNAEC